MSASSQPSSLLAADMDTTLATLENTGRSVHVRFYRHAESEFNATGSKIVDCELSKNGRTQAARLPKQMFDLIIVSPLRRAKQTLAASPLKSRYPVQTVYDCREWLDGNPMNHLPHESNVRCEQSEMLTARCERFYRYIRSQCHLHPDISSIAVISHGLFLQRLLGTATHLQNAMHVDRWFYISDSASPTTVSFLTEPKRLSNHNNKKINE